MRIFILPFIILIATIPTWGSPQSISVSGYLTDSSGTPLGASTPKSVNVEVRIGANNCYAYFNRINSVSVSDGVFSIDIPNSGQNLPTRNVASTALNVLFNISATSPSSFLGEELDGVDCPLSSSAQDWGVHLTIDSEPLGIIPLKSVPWSVYAQKAETAKNADNATQAASASTVPWSGITGKPTNFADVNMLAGGRLTSSCSAPDFFRGFNSDGTAICAVASPLIGPGTITALEIASEAVTSDELASSSVTAAKIASSAITIEKISRSGCTQGQALTVSASGPLTCATMPDPNNLTSIRLSPGTAASPSIIFQNENDSGIYRADPNTIGFSTGGVARVLIDGTGRTQILGHLAVVSGALTVGAGGSPTTNIVRCSLTLTGASGSSGSLVVSPCNGVSPDYNCQCSKNDSLTTSSLTSIQPGLPTTGQIQVHFNGGIPSGTKVSCICMK